MSESKRSGEVIVCGLKVEINFYPNSNDWEFRLLRRGKDALGHDKWSEIGFARRQAPANNRQFLQSIRVWLDTYAASEMWPEVEAKIKELGGQPK